MPAVTAEKPPCPGKNAGPDTRARMIEQLLADTAEDPLKLVSYFRHLVTCTASPALEVAIEEVVEKGCLPKIVAFLSNDRMEVQREAAWVLGNVAFRGKRHILEITDAGGVAPMVALLGSSDLSTQKISAQSLANLASLIPGRDEAFAQGVGTSLTPLLMREEVWSGTCMLLRNLCMDRHPPPSLTSLTPCLPTLCRLALHGAADISDDSCIALVSLNKHYGSHLSPNFGPTFLAKLLKLQRQHPERRGFARLLYELTKTTPTSSSHTQADAVNGSTQGSSTPQGSPTLGAAPHASVGRKARNRSPSPVSSLSSGASSRHKTKRLKIDPLSPGCLSPARPKTRASSQRFLTTTPDHSASHIYRKKDELFRAVEEGDLDSVEHLVRHTGPGVTRGMRGDTLLHAAAEHNQAHVVLYLLEFISPNTVNNHGHTAAHVAAANGHIQALRMLMSDPVMDPDQRDSAGHTYTHWLASHLFEAVLKEDVKRVRSLLSVGADADQEVERAARGPLARELQVTSARDLARALRHESILRALDKKRRPARPPKDVTSIPLNSTPLIFLQPGSPHIPMKAPPVEVSGEDVYAISGVPRGYVCILSYDSFRGRPDLQLKGSKTDAQRLASVFFRMGYSGHVHLSLTAGQTRQQLAALRDDAVLQQAGCAIFVVSSHGSSRQHFLTSDMHTVDAHWLLHFFKDSQCPALKNKPKIFIWNLCRGHHREEGGGGCGEDSRRPLLGRVEEPLRDVLSLDASSGGLSWHSFSEECTPFIGALCRTLARHGHAKELTELYRYFLQEYARAAPDAVPQLTNHGFTKRFYFYAKNSSHNNAKV